MIQLQASQGAIESRPNTLNLTVMKGKKIVGVAFAAGESEPGLDLSTIVPDVPVPFTAILKVQDKKKGWIEKGSISIQANFVSITSATIIVNESTRPTIYSSVARGLPDDVSYVRVICIRIVAGLDRPVSTKYRRHLKMMSDVWKESLAWDKWCPPVVHAL
jgi:hypothetical protein